MGLIRCPIAPQDRFCVAYSVSNDYRTDFCTFRGWILCSIKRFRKLLKPGREKKKTSEQKPKQKKVTKKKRMERKKNLMIVFGRNPCAA